MNDEGVFSHEEFERKILTMSVGERIAHALALGSQELRAYARANEITEEEALALLRHQRQLDRPHYSRSKAGW
jgi:hypothetical protein